MSYKRLSLEERHYIKISLKNEKILSETGENPGRSQGTITREIARNKGQRGYHHNQANGTWQISVIKQSLKPIN